MFSAKQRPLIGLVRRSVRPAAPAARRLAATAASRRPPTWKRVTIGLVGVVGAVGAVGAAVGAGYLWPPRAIRNDDGGRGRVVCGDTPGRHAPSSLSYAAFLPRGLTPDDVTHLLGEQAFSVVAPGGDAGGALRRYDGAQVASNSPCEDRLVHGTLASPRRGGSRWAAWAVLDGHAGAATADVLSRALVPFVQDQLGRVFEAAGAASDDPDEPDEPNEPREAAIEQAIARAFVDLDETIMATATAAAETADDNRASLADRARALLPAFSGSCALLALYDPDTGRLHVACTGDSRAVLGRQHQPDDGTWETLPLSVDQTGRNADEVARLQAAHPGEDATLVQNGRVLGLAVSRAFGDGRWKWPAALSHDMRRRFFAPTPLTPRFDLRSPPYLTAEPVVTTTHLVPGQPAFLILATDGLWDNLESAHAVHLIARWLRPPAPPLAARRVDDTPANDTPASDTPADDTPVDLAPLWADDVACRFAPARAVVEDANAAVHLLRNGLRANSAELLAARLSYGAPFSRNMYDDVSVQVIFFNCPK